MSFLHSLPTRSLIFFGDHFRPSCSLIKAISNAHLSARMIVLWTSNSTGMLPQTPYHGSGRQGPSAPPTTTSSLLLPQIPFKHPSMATPPMYLHGFLSNHKESSDIQWLSQRRMLSQLTFLSNIPFSGKGNDAIPRFHSQELQLVRTICSYALTSSSRLRLTTCRPRHSYNLGHAAPGA